MKQAKEATVLIVNPTHVAIALQCDLDNDPVPIVTARGLNETALAMRQAAAEAKVVVLWANSVSNTLTTRNPTPKASAIKAPGENLTDYRLASDLNLPRHLV